MIQQECSELMFPERTLLVSLSKNYGALLSVRFIFNSQFKLEMTFATKRKFKNFPHPSFSGPQHEEKKQLWVKEHGSHRQNVATREISDREHCWWPTQKATAMRLFLGLTSKAGSVESTLKKGADILSQSQPSRARTMQLHTAPKLLP